MAAPDATPLSSLPRLASVETGPLSAAVSVTAVDRSDPLFAGHYPGFPIFPGVCLVESVHQSLLAAAAADGQRVRLIGVDSARFLGPVFPGDEITTRLRVTVLADGAMRCAAQLATDRGPAASVRLRYATEVAG